MRVSALLSAGLIVISAVLSAFAPAASASVLSLKEIRDKGVIIQKWDTSCGAAAMATVFTFTGAR